MKSGNLVFADTSCTTDPRAVIMQQKDGGGTPATAQEA